MRSFLANVPLFVPGMILTILIAGLASRSVARALGTRSTIAFLGILAVGGILSATLTPGTAAVLRGIPSSGGCDLSRLGLIPLSELISVNDHSLNVLLFIPLGVVIGLLPHSRRATIILAAALLSPLIIESVQALLPVLGRGCQSADIADNLTGLVIGLALGTLVARVSATA